MDNLLADIIAFTDKAHGAQSRKYTPDRYIVHPVRVMQLWRTYTNELPVLAAAILHDIRVECMRIAAKERRHLGPPRPDCRVRTDVSLSL